MAQRRMFSMQIVDTDAFLDMPLTTQLLYFHFGMRADDDGFVSNPKKVMRMIGSGEDDLKVLITKRFIIPFKNGVCVIKHWKINNYIQKDRYNETKYLEEKAKLITKENGSYTECIQNGYTGKVRLGKLREEGETSSRVLSKRVQYLADTFGSEFKVTDRIIDLIDKEYKDLVIKFAIDKMAAKYEEEYHKVPTTMAVINWLNNAKKFGELERRGE
jgi:hypothetical protein